MNTEQFEEVIVSEKSCREFLFDMRWPDGLICPNCEKIIDYVMANGVYVCSRCSYKTSVTAGTLLDKTHIPLQIWLQVLWAASTDSGKEKLTAKWVENEFSLGSSRTAQGMLKKIKQGKYRPVTAKLSGKVECKIDTVTFQRPKPQKGQVHLYLATFHEVKKNGRTRGVILSSQKEKAVPLIYAFIERIIEKGTTLQRNDIILQTRELENRGYFDFPLVHNSKQAEAFWSSYKKLINPAKKLSENNQVFYERASCYNSEYYPIGFEELVRQMMTTPPLPSKNAKK